MNENTLDLQFIFNYLNGHKTGQIDVNYINKLIKTIDNLKSKQRDSQGAPLDSTSGDSQKTSKSGMSKALPSTKATIQKSISNVNDTDSSSQLRSKRSIEMNEPEESEIESSIEIRQFPNKKTKLDITEFSTLFKELMSKEESEEEILKSCFQVFDFERNGVADAYNIQQVLEIFGESVSLNDIQNVLKSLDCQEDRMTFENFKDFYQKMK